MKAAVEQETCFKVYKGLSAKARTTDPEISRCHLPQTVRRQAGWHAIFRAVGILSSHNVC